ncbi:MAG: rhodanese-like domain-containing protein [Planctomycetota bacterium]|jgi:rhodanese-related sulfurtransferase
MIPDADIVMESEVKYMRNLRMGWTVLIIITVVVVVAVAAKLYMSRSGADVSQEQLQEWMRQQSDLCILDVRSVREYNSGHIAAAINIGHTEVSAHLDKLRPYADKNVVVYCEKGVQARIAQRALTTAGFSSVYHLTGDMAGWRDAGLSVETPGDKPD